MRSKQQHSHGSGRRALGLTALLAAPLAGASGLATQSFRDEHQEMRAHLEHVSESVGELPRQERARQRETAEQVTAFFEQRIRPHAEWEEQHLYPVIDRLAGTTEANRFTATMRYEHKVVGRWIGELRAELAKPTPDFVAFSRRADNLLGLVSAHFEEEEEVLLPYADRKMTRDEFERAVELKGTGPH